MSDPTPITFTGTVVECTTRYRTTAKKAVLTDPFGADWVAIVEIAEAGEGAPWPIGERTAFMFHSPTHVFLESAEEVVGGRFRFTIDRHDVEQGMRWDNLRGRRL